MTSLNLSRGIKKHPYISAFILWLYLFLAFGYFDVEKVVTLSFILPMLIAGILAYIYFLRKEKLRRIPEKKRKSPLLALGVAVYSLLMVYSFSIFPTDDFIKSRNSFVPLIFLLAGLIAWCVYLTVKKKWSVNRIILCIFLFSCIIHLFFLLTAKFNVVMQDMGSIGENGDGHFGYISYLYNHLLPAQFDPRERWQFYHPPLFYYSAALLFRVLSFFGIRLQTAIYNIQFLNMLYIMFVSVCFYKIASLFRTKKLPMILAFSVFTLSPTMDYVALLQSSDILAFLFFMLCVYYTIVWYRDQRAKHILKIALCFGLGMLSKMSVALAALPIAVVFIYALIQKLRTKDMKSFGRLFGQMCAFLGVAAPLSLYWSLRNLIRFGVPLGYVPLSSLEPIQNPVSQRLFDYFSPGQYTNPFFNTIAVDSFDEYNPIIALIKTSASDFGVERARTGMILGYAVLLFTAAVAVASFVFMIYVIVRKNTISGLAKAFFSVMYIEYIYSYLSFCINFPHYCTEQIRYAMPLIMIGALFIGFGIRELQKSRRRQAKAVVRAVSVMVFAFSFVAAAVVLRIGTMITIDWLMTK